MHLISCSVSRVLLFPRTFFIINDKSSRPWDRALKVQIHKQAFPIEIIGYVTTQWNFLHSSHRKWQSPDRLKWRLNFLIAYRRVFVAVYTDECVVYLRLLSTAYRPVTERIETSIRIVDKHVRPVTRVWLRPVMSLSALHSQNDFFFVKGSDFGFGMPVLPQID